MPYLPVTSMGADETAGTPLPPEVTAQLTEIDENTRRILASQAKAETRWKWQAIAGAVGAIFAAVKLGWVVIPSLKQRRRPLGGLPSLQPNPHRRRRPRRR